MWIKVIHRNFVSKFRRKFFYKFLKFVAFLLLRPRVDLKYPYLAADIDPIIKAQLLDSRKRTLHNSDARIR